MFSRSSYIFPHSAIRRIVILFTILICFALLYTYSGSFLEVLPLYSVQKQQAAPTVNLVVASIASEDTSWITSNFPSYNVKVYVADDPAATYTVPRNKGREANVFLTYLIDHYDTLPEISVFLHGKRYQWHNEDPLYDGIPVLKQLRLPYVQQEGFATLRCSWEYGCPAELRPNASLSVSEVDAILASPKEWFSGGVDDRGKTEAVYARSYAELFGSAAPLPSVVAVHCGAQFAATAATIRRRSREDYIHFRQWLWETDLGDDLSGRIMEYVWHIIFGKESVLCPDAGKCFCEKFGLCKLEGCKESGCDKRFWVHFGVLPEGWPDVGTGQDGWPPKNWAD